MKKISEDTQNIKVDRLCYNTDYGDIFSCEDKPSDATTAKADEDLEKSTLLREQTLLYWRTMLPIPASITVLEAISAQFHGLTLTIYGSKMLKNGSIIHYQKCRTTIPTHLNTYTPKAAYFLLVMMSLKRNIMLNFIKLSRIAALSEEDSLTYLSSAKNYIHFREDSPCSTESGSSLSNNEENGNWIQTEKERRF